MKIKQGKYDGLKGFGVFYLLFFFVGLIVLFSINHGDVVLWLNGISIEELDSFVNLLTDLGLGSTIALLMVLLSLIKIRYAIMGLVNLGLVGLFTNLFKKFLFPGKMRPLNYFLYDDFPRFLHAAELNYHSSFPSGHTMTIFSAMSILAYFTGKKTWGGILFFCALIIGFTRIYLLQHFFLDVYVGSVLGMVCTLLTIWIFDVKLSLNNWAAFQKPLYRLRFSTSGQ